METYPLYGDCKVGYCYDATLPKLIYRFYTISVKTQEAFFTEIDKLLLKFYKNAKDPKSQNDVEEK